MFVLNRLKIVPNRLKAIKIHLKASTRVLKRLKTPRVEKGTPFMEPLGRFWSL